MAAHNPRRQRASSAASLPAPLESPNRITLFLEAAGHIQNWTLESGMNKLFKRWGEPGEA